MGFQSPTHVSKSQHGGKVPTFLILKKLLKYDSIHNVKSDLDYFMQKKLRDLC